MDQLRFSIPEILSLIGVAQCVYVIVYMAFRSGRISRGGLAVLYFMLLGLAFLSDFAASASPSLTKYYFYIQWFAWFYGPPVSVLLIIQIAQISQVPALRHYWVMVLIPIAFLVSYLAVGTIEGCRAKVPCAELRDWLTLSGLVAGAVSLLDIWMKRDLFSGIAGQKTGKERYWLILALIFANIFFLSAMLFSFSPRISHETTVLIRTGLGLAFVYLVSTSLFRIYPQAVRVSAGADKDGSLSAHEHAIAEKIEQLLNREKVYQEQAYSRTDLARECGTSETVISKVINSHFQKSFPQIVNEYRIEDAKRLLRETDAAIKVVAAEVGFNSLPSFNRVFKDMTGLSPSEWRKTE